MVSTCIYIGLYRYCPLFTMVDLYFGIYFSIFGGMRIPQENHVGIQLGYNQQDGTQTIFLLGEQMGNLRIFEGKHMRTCHGIQWETQWDPYSRFIGMLPPLSNNGIRQFISYVDPSSIGFSHCIIYPMVLEHRTIIYKWLRSPSMVPQDMGLSDWNRKPKLSGVV